MRAPFFAAIACGLLSSWLVGRQSVAAILLLLWLLRVGLLRDRRCLTLTVVISAVVGGWLTWQNARFERVTRSAPRVVNLTLAVQPDAVSTRGGQYQLVATTSGVGRVIVYGKLATAADKRRLNALTTRTRWQTSGTLSPVAPPTNPGQFDAPAYYRSQGIDYQYTVTRVAGVHPAVRRGGAGILDQLHQWRAGFYRACRRLPATLQVYATSLLIGLRPASFHSTMAGVQQLGLLYLFSLSGMHVILFLGMLRWLLIRLHVSLPTIDWWLLGCLPVYLVMGGGADSLQRAVITAGLPLIWQHFSHQQRGALTGWSWALIIGIVHNPLVLCQLGGQLSYGLALLLMVKPLRSPWRLAWWVQLISMPVLLIATAQWHLLTVFVNLLVAPLFSWVLLPVTLIGASLGQWLPGVAGWCDGILAAFQRVIATLATWPGLLIIGQPSATWAWALGLLSLWCLRSPTKRWFSWLAVAYGCCLVSIRFPWRGAVQFIDVGQGDSILIRQPFNRTVSLIDTGGRLKFPVPRWQNDGTTVRPRVETVTVNYLHRLGITHIDTVYLSHKDVDHIGDLGALLRLMPVKRVVVPAGMAALPKFQRLLRPAQRPPQVVEALAGMQFSDGLTAVHPFKPGKAENGDSLVLTGNFGQQRFMFTGDLDRAGERAIMTRYPQLRVDVLKLGHHGSKTASDPQVLKQLGVQRGILSVGRHNRYGHPNQETLTTLRQQHIVTYSTALQGMVTYRFTPGHWGVWQTFLKEGNLYQRTTSPQSNPQG
ncbi:DNA internalization-related competence protein ComEC/Rec2 [Lactiplantibacillus garii]|uniref:DNA internalization-related competence protein ComEC/Rec2 n=1 Tax=Lactiplantibacillus garii TaxID=2306423 RepID=A0A426DA85_9LACO|nr:DNA internalization-related competence protein ComEC/Rec2 [Lactiplantibacillus garii]RRK11614.1 DNA internalization-related competence protein ComEC/Rec2 [Lactiplantibacillus garii]